MKKFILSFFMLLGCLSSSFADENNISIVADIPASEQIPAAARKTLQNKLQTILTKNGLGGTLLDPRFVLTANVVEETKDVLSTGMYAYTLNVHLYIGDGVSGTLFATTTVRCKGAGETETKAYNMALKQMNVNAPEYQTFISEGKKKIVEYYTSQCDAMIKGAETASNQGNYSDAVAQLMDIPSECTECYNKAMDKVSDFYKKMVDKDGQEKLAKAKSVWMATQDQNAAQQAGEILMTIDPNSSSYAEAVKLSDQITKKIKEQQDREYQYQLKEQENAHNEKMSLIKAAKAAAVAQAKNQPKVMVYSYSRWYNY